MAKGMVQELARESDGIATGDALDRAHLQRMTLGDADLEREVLALFAQQLDLLLERMRHGPDADVAALAHTLKGSAQGIGAWAIAEAAQAVEDAEGNALEPALRVLDAAILRWRQNVAAPAQR